MSDPIIFADVFNQFLYHGKQVIKPNQLQEMDSKVISIPYGLNSKKSQNQNDDSKQTYRDILRLMKTDGNVAYCLLGIENQSNIHYAMPVKNGLYDMMKLSDQVSSIAKKNRKNKKLNSAEFLSGFRKRDKLIPIITLVIYWGADPWDGSRSLHEMYGDIEKDLLKYVPDYKINLIVPAEMTEDELKQFTTSLREVMTYIKFFLS